LRTLGVEYSSGFDITQNGIRIMVPDIPAFMEILRLNGIILHPNVDVVEGRIVLGTIPAHGTGFYFAAAAIIAVPFVIVALFIVRSRRRRD
jgi:hypothetical protein